MFEHEFEGLWHYARCLLYRGDVASDLFCIVCIDMRASRAEHRSCNGPRRGRTATLGAESRVGRVADAVGLSSIGSGLRRAIASRAWSTHHDGKANSNGDLWSPEELIRSGPRD